MCTGDYNNDGFEDLVVTYWGGFILYRNNGDGTFTQTGGTVILGDGPDTGAFVLGAGTTASGTYTLGGTGYLNVTGYEFIGSRGFGLLQEYGGAFIQTNGTNTVNGDQYIGYSDFSTGVYTLSGGADNVAGNLYAGVNGDGVFNLTGGSLVVAAGGGTITLPGTGTILAQGGALIGFSSLSDGTFNQSGGTATIGTASARGNIYIGTSVTSSGTYSLTGASAVLKVFGLEDVGVVSVGDVSDGQIDEFGGIFTQSAGSNTSTRSLIVGEYSGATGQYALSGGSYSDGGNIYLGDLGGATGVFSQSAGALTLAGFNRSVSLNSGTMIVNGGVAGLYGTGTFYQSGGIFTIGTGTTSSNLWVGVATTSLGNYSLTGPGAQLQVYGDEHIAVYAAGSTANNAITQSGGVFNQSNGTNSLTGNLFVADNAGATGQYNLGGGTCTVGSNLFLASGTGGIGAFQQTAGTLSVNGRIAEMITTGGEKVWPDEVERVLSGHAGVAEVAVWKRPDAEWGERVVAWVVPTGEVPSVAELTALVAESLAPWAAPKEIVLTAELPRTPSGKVRRADLR